jgi:hypothetical protein
MPKKLSVACIVVALGLLTVAAAAQQRGRGGRGGPSEPPRWPADAEYLQWPLPAGEQAYAKINGGHLKEYVNQITAISRKSRDDGNQYWGRITGTPYDKQTTDWVAAQFRRIGLEQVRIQEFDGSPRPGTSASRAAAKRCPSRRRFLCPDRWEQPRAASNWSPCG